MKCSAAWWDAKRRRKPQEAGYFPLESGPSVLIRTSMVLIGPETADATEQSTMCEGNFFFNECSSKIFNLTKKKKKAK